MQPHAETPRQPASTLPYRSDITEGAAILARMIEDMRGAEELAPHDAVIDRDFFISRGWTRHQFAAYGPRAIKAFRAGPAR